MTIFTNVLSIEDALIIQFNALPVYWKNQQVNIIQVAPLWMSANTALIMGSSLDGWQWVSLDELGCDRDTLQLINAQSLSNLTQESDRNDHRD